MLRAVLADLHLGERPGDVDRFRSVVDEVLRRGAGELVLLGDVFRTLVGLPQFWDEEVRAGLEELRRLRRAGARVVLVEGNRDFFLDERALDDFRDRAAPCHSFSAGGRRFLLEHGDLVNVRDWRYLAWRRLAKSRAARLWARLLPPRLARRIVAYTEARLAETNFSYRSRIPEERLQRVAQAHFAAGVHVVLWGHFHHPWHFALGTRLGVVVPAFAEYGAVVWVRGDTGEIVLGLLEGAQFVDTSLQSWYQEHDGSEGARENYGSDDPSCG
jgi:UDP-2,3-diacylglucosamine pyrophosphatase LpxH